MLVKVIQIILFIVWFFYMNKKIPQQSCADVQIFGNVTVWAKWQIVIPNEVRKLIWVHSGDTLMVMVKHGKAIWLIKSDEFEQFVSMMQEELEILKHKK